MSHLHPSPYYKPDLGEEYNEFRGRVNFASRDDDYKAIMQISGNIRRNVAQQLLDSDAQLKKLNFHPPNKPAAKWQIDMVYAMRIFLHPVNEMDKVLPLQAEPNEEEMKEYSILLSEKVNEEFFRDSVQWASIIQKDSKWEALCITVNALLLIPFTGTKPGYDEDKDEGHTDDFFSAFAHCLHIGNPQNNKLVLQRNLEMDTNLGEFSYTTKVEFGVRSRSFGWGQGPVYAFVEDKRLNAGDIQKIIAQRMAEGLAVANCNYQSGLDQQVFGISVRHRFFTFWSGYFPAQYLDTVQSNPTNLSLSQDYAIMKCYPASNFGLDFCIPDDRRNIIRAMLRIIKYTNNDYVL